MDNCELLSSWARSSTFVQELAQFRGRSGPFESSFMWISIAADGDSIGEVVEKRATVKPLDWWEALFKGHPLYTPARRALSMVPTSAAVERANSIQGSIHSKSRNRLSQDKVNSLMRVTFNRRMEASASKKANERRALANTFATTTDVLLLEDSEEEEGNADF